MSAIASPAGSRRWLFGPASDLLLGCGLAYMAIFVLLAFAAERMEQAIPLWSFLIISLFFSAPHYGATLLRVYERREDRRAYALFTIWITAALWGVFAFSVHSPAVGSILFTLYYTWSPWHYSGQNYGVAVMFLGRRGISVSRNEKRLLHATFLLSYAIVFVALHGSGGSTGYAPSAIEAGSYRFLSVGFSQELAYLLYPLLGAAYAGCLVTLLVRLTRRVSLGDLTPVLVLLGVQALWFVMPPLARAGAFQELHPLSSQGADYVAVWIASAHAIQYLWVTTFYAARGEGYGGRSRYLLKALLAGTAIWGVPTLLFAPNLLGDAPYNLGLFLMVAATVNLHHFVLDGAIWKLRDKRIAKILMRSAVGSTGAPIEPGAAGGGQRSFLRPLVWATGLLCLFLFVAGDLEYEFGVSRASARGDAERLELAARRLAWIGRESPRVHHQLALLARQRGDLAAAERELRTALSVYETKNAWNNLGSLYLDQRRWAEAQDAYAHALSIDPALLPALDGAASAALALGDRPRAIALLRRAAQEAPRNQAVRRRLAEVSETRDPDRP